MLTFVVRRLLVQRRMLAAVVVLITAATTLLGVASLLLGVTEDRAFAEEVERAQPPDVDVTAFLVDLAGSDLVATREEARDVVSGVLAPMDPTVTSSATSRIRRFPGGERLGYLATSDAFDQRADLTSGRWPAAAADGPPEAVVPDAAVDRLGVGLGDQVTLDSEVGLEGVDAPVTVVVVGTFRPRARAGWDSDPLHGAGFEAAYSDGSVTAPAYGPFVVTDDAFLATGSTVSGLRVTAHPTLSLADDPALRAAVADLDGASALLSARVGDQVRITRVASELPRTVGRLHAQQDAARSTVLVVLLLGLTLSLVALLLAGRLVAAVRDDERALLVGFGLGRRQQVGAALREALLVAAAATVLAVPVAALAHSRLTHLPEMRAAGLAQDPTVTSGLVLSVLAGAVVLTFALVLPALDVGAGGASSRRRARARTGLEVLLVVAVVAGWWQLRSQPATAATSGDLTLTVAPVVCLVGATVILVRGVPLLLTLVARAGARSRRLVLPLAANQAARRPHTGAAMVLVATAIAAGTFGTALNATWERSQEDQAALRVGTDLTLVLPAAATADEAVAVIAATSDDPEAVVSAVADRPLALGRYVGAAGSAPVLVAVDSRQTGALLRGRLDDDRTWAEIGAGLTPGPAVGGVTLPPDGAEVELTGEAPPGVAVLATPTAVVEDSAGFRSAIGAEPLPVDGRPHPVRWQSPLGSGRLVAVQLELSDDPGADPGTNTDTPISVSLRVPGGTVGSETWTARPVARQTPIQGAAISVEPVGADAVLRTTVQVDLSYFAYTGADVLATAFETPADIPVAVSQQLADAVGTKVGGELSATVGDTVLPLRVTAVVPTVPSAPGQAAVLADIDTLSRALIATGRLDPVIDAWWVGSPTPRTEEALRASELGDVTTREEVGTQLTGGPMRVTVPVALLTLGVAASVLLLAGAGLVVSADRRRRTAEVTRLRALGLTRQDSWRLLLAEHAVFLLPLVLVGALVGAGAAITLGPSLIRSDLGAAPVPSAVVVWPWLPEAVLVGVLLLGCLVITAVVTGGHVRRSGTALLRTDGS